MYMSEVYTRVARPGASGRPLGSRPESVAELCGILLSIWARNAVQGACARARKYVYDGGMAVDPIDRIVVRGAWNAMRTAAGREGVGVFFSALHL